MTAVALIAYKRPSPSPHEMMLTVVANRRIASRMTLITTGISPRNARLQYLIGRPARRLQGFAAICR